MIILYKVRYKSTSPLIGEPSHTHIIHIMSRISSGFFFYSGETSRPVININIRFDDNVCFYIHPRFSDEILVNCPIHFNMYGSISGDLQFNTKTNFTNL